jgi:hypothetical protein
MIWKDFGLQSPRSVSGPQDSETRAIQESEVAPPLLEGTAVVAVLLRKPQHLVAVVVLAVVVLAVVVPAVVALAVVVLAVGEPYPPHARLDPPIQ